MRDLVVRSARIAGAPQPVDIGIDAGVVVDVTPSGGSGPGRSRSVLDAGGRVVIPGLVESHLHLDKALLGVPAGGSTLQQAIAETARRKATFTRDDIRERALQVLRWAVSSGTTAVRAHTEVDPGVGLLGIDTVGQIAEELAGAITLQIAVFPQEGIHARRGTLDLMREALRRPGAVVGGCPYAEPDVETARRHVDTVLDLAVEFETRADLHLDLADHLLDPRHVLAEYVAAAALERGLQGRVAIGHATTLSALDPVSRVRVLDALARAEVTVTLLPATDIYLNGRADVRDGPGGGGHPTGRAIAPVRELWSAGVPTALSSNNVRNAFTPTGRADLLDIGLLLVRVAGLSDPGEFRAVLDMATSGGRQAMGLGGIPPLSAGAPADLVVLDSDRVDDVVLDQPERMAVVAGGRIVMQRQSLVRWPHGAGAMLA